MFVLAASQGSNCIPNRLLSYRWPSFESYRSTSSRKRHVSCGKPGSRPLLTSTHIRQHLWTLVSSKTVFDAVTTQLHLRRFTISNALVPVLWSQSPLGGQASLRVIGKGKLTTEATSPLRYMDTGPLPLVYTGEYSGISMFGTAALSVQASYAAALMQGFSTKISPRDAWENVKIPRLERLKTTELGQNIFEWSVIPRLSQVEDYTSLFGLPVAGVSRNATSIFVVENDYVSLSSSGTRTDTSQKHSTFFNSTCQTCPQSGMKGSMNFMTNDQRVRLLLGLETNYTDIRTSNKTVDVPPLDQSPANTLRFVWRGTGKSTSTTCGVTRVEAMIRCTSDGCAADKVRPLNTSPLEKNVTLFDY